MELLLSILADLNDEDVWNVNVLPVISNSSGDFLIFYFKPLETVPSAFIIIATTVILKYQSLFKSSLARF